MQSAHDATTPSEEATYNALMPGMPELSGLRQRLNSCVDEMELPQAPPQDSSSVAAKEKQQPMAIAVPLYIYPNHGSWDALFDVIQRHTSTEFFVVVNPANGPGKRVPDSNYIRDVARLNTYQNCKIFGYVHVSWAARKLSLVQGDITTWSHWRDYSQADIHVEGIFVDEAPSDIDHLSYMKSVYTHCKEELGTDALVWTNPGVQIDSAFYQAADLVNSHENTLEGWRTSSLSNNQKSTSMIHTYTASMKEMMLDLAVLKQAGYRSVLLTTSNCYTSFSTFLDQFAAAIEQLNAGIARAQ